MTKTQTTKLNRLTAEARNQGFTVAEKPGRIDIFKAPHGRTITLGVAIYHDDGRFNTAHRIDVPLEIATGIRSLNKCAKILGFEIPPA